MHRSWIPGIALALVLFIGSGPAAAQDFERSGLYVGGSWFRVGEQFGDELDEQVEDALDLDDADLSVGDTRGFGAVLGVRLGSRLALELVAERYDDLDIDHSIAGIPASGDLELWAGLAMAKLYLFTGRVQPYLTAGAGYLRGEVEIAGEDEVGHAALGRGGAGVEVYLSPNVLLNVQAAYSRGLTSDLEDLAYFTVGGSVIFRF